MDWTYEMDVLTQWLCINGNPYRNLGEIVLWYSVDFTFSGDVVDQTYNILYRKVSKFEELTRYLNLSIHTHLLGDCRNKIGSNINFGSINNLEPFAKITTRGKKLAKRMNKSAKEKCQNVH